ncbi:hypothetical protein J3F84DRAFT_357709 [Trichoderma pleuroticola]
MTIPGHGEEEEGASAAVICCRRLEASSQQQPAEPIQHNLLLDAPLKYGHAGGSTGENRSRGGLHASSTYFELAAAKSPVAKASLFAEHSNNTISSTEYWWRISPGQNKKQLDFANKLNLRKEEKRKETKRNQESLLSHTSPWPIPVRHPACICLLHLHTSRSCQPWPRLESPRFAILFHVPPSFFPCQVRAYTACCVQCEWAFPGPDKGHVAATHKT